MTTMHNNGSLACYLKGSRWQKLYNVQYFCEN